MLGLIGIIMVIYFIYIVVDEAKKFPTVMKEKKLLKAFHNAKTQREADHIEWQLSQLK